MWALISNNLAETDGVKTNLNSEVVCHLAVIIEKRGKEKL